MSEDNQVIDDEETDQPNKPNLGHWVQAMGETVEEFREYLNRETDRLTRVKSRQLGQNYEFGEAKAQLDPEMHAHLHRLKIAADNFLNALMGNY
jgi:hypothetical protein